MPEDVPPLARTRALRRRAALAVVRRMPERLLPPDDPSAPEAA